MPATTRPAKPHPQKTYAQCVVTLDRFLEMLDNQSWTTPRRQKGLARQRHQLLATLKTLLVWHRPDLAEDRGIGWPYHALALRSEPLHALVKDHPDSGIRAHAHLFLALLPFPGQWQWLLSAEKDLAGNPELGAYLEAETDRIRRKWAGKNQRLFRLRHFCQILKRPRPPQEKGVLRIFSLPYLMANPRLVKDLSQNYLFFVEPPSGIVFRHTWLRVFSRLCQPTLFGMGSQEDRSFLNTQPNIRTTHLAHGEFLPSTPFYIPANPPRYDFAFNGTFDGRPGKRHSLMLDLMQHPLLHNRTTLFLGRGSQQSVMAFQQEIESKGLTSRATVVDNIKRTEVPAYLAQCRVGVHLSLYENVCRAVFEFWRAGLPCVTSTAMAGTRWDRFNTATGLVVPDRDLPVALLRAVQHRGRFSPRRWLTRTTGSDHATRQLNEILKAQFLSLGYPWSENIFQLSSSGANRYAQNGDYEQCQPDYRRLVETFQTFLPRDLELVVE